MISAEQIKAARAMSDWSQDALAQATGLSPRTIHNLEMGYQSPRSSKAVRRIFEDKGFEFFELNGLSRCTDKTKIYKGTSGRDKFYNDLLVSAKEKGGEIGAIFGIQETLADALGVPDYFNLERLERLSKFATVKCLLADAQNSLTFIPSFQFRAIPRHPFIPMSSFIYGNKTAIIVTDGVEFVYHVIQSAEVTQKSWNDFRLRWDAGLPIVMQQANSQKKPHLS